MIVSYKLTFISPISKVTENMKRAQTRDAVLNQKLHFRSKLATCDAPPEVKGAHKAPSLETVEMTINEIINGDGKEFPGLVPLIRQFLDGADVDVDTRCTITQYLNFIQKRASGEIWTLAHWMREFVQQHADYKQDSFVPDTTVYDMLNEVSKEHHFYLVFMIKK